MFLIFYLYNATNLQGKSSIVVIVFFRFPFIISG